MQQNRNEGNFLKHHPSMKNPQLTSYLTVKEWMLSAKIRNKTGMFSSSYLLNTVLEFLTKAVRQEKEIKGI